VLHILIWGIEAFSGGISGAGTEFCVPHQLGGMESGWYGSACAVKKLIEAHHVCKIVVYNLHPPVGLFMCVLSSEGWGKEINLNHNLIVFLIAAKKLVKVFGLTMVNF